MQWARLECITVSSLSYVRSFVLVDSRTFRARWENVYFISDIKCPLCRSALWKWTWYVGSWRVHCVLPLSGQRRERDSGVCINCSNLAPTMLHRFSKNFLHSDNSVICIQRINPGQALLSFSSSQLPFQRISISALRRRVVFECSLSVPDTTDITYFIRRCKKDLRSRLEL